MHEVRYAGTNTSLDDSARHTVRANKNAEQSSAFLVSARKDKTKLLQLF
jgi:hypothetical protein